MEHACGRCAKAIHDMRRLAAAMVVQPNGSLMWRMAMEFRREEADGGPGWAAGVDGWSVLEFFPVDRGNFCW